MTRAFAAAATIALATMAVHAQPGPRAAGWLDQPVAGWNRAGAPLPKAVPIDAEAAGAPRCRELSRPPSLPTDRALHRAGWTLVGAAQVFGGTVVAAAMTNVDGMCRPLNYQYFVFVDGRFAGTLSPAPMDARTDGAAGTVTLVGKGDVVAEFARYAPEDPLCCPSRVSRVGYRIEGAGGSPLVVPVTISTAPATR